MKKLIALLLSLCLIAGIMPVMAESTRMHENTAEELLSQARALQDEGRYEEAVPLLQKAADMGDAPAVSAKDTTLTVEEICQAGAAAYDVGDYAKAAAYYELALKCYREAAGKGEEVAAEEPDRLVDEENAAPNAAVDTGTDRLERLQALNRASIANMSIGEGPVYVIGHRSPDSDTICSAIAYARLLTMLGYPAEAAANGPVNHETEFILKAAGVEAPPVLEDASGKSIFLVDHSEYAQSTEGLVDAHIVGILDHHGVGSVSTGHQVVYEAKPIGATATIIWLDYLNYGLEIDKPTATLLLGAILSDTTNLTGSTVTEADRQAVSDLAGIAEITDVKAFYLELHAEALSYDGMSDEEILFSDYKEYEVAGVKFGIGLLSVIDEDHARALAERMKEALPQGFEKVQVDLLYASVGIREDGVKTDFIVPCEGQSRDYFEAAFPNYDEYDGTSYIFRNGGLGRKTKFVPGLTDYINAHPHE